MKSVRNVAVNSPKITLNPSPAQNSSFNVTGKIPKIVVIEVRRTGTNLALQPSIRFTKWNYATLGNRVGSSGFSCLTRSVGKPTANL